MDPIFNITNLKSTITFLHLAGLILGVGGVWIIDSMLLAHFNEKLTRERYQSIELIAKKVTAGLAILWVSGCAFIVYYYFFTPEYLYNQKVWAKVFIVSVLTLNGVLVHLVVLPYLRKCIGYTFFERLSHRELRLVSSIGAISILSWLLPIILGVTKTLNFTATALQISTVYILISAVCLALVNIFIVYLADRVLEKQTQNGSRPPKQRKGRRAGLEPYLGNLRINQ